MWAYCSQDPAFIEPVNLSSFLVNIEEDFQTQSLNSRQYFQSQLQP